MISNLQHGKKTWKRVQQDINEALVHVSRRDPIGGVSAWLQGRPVSGILAIKNVLDNSSSFARAFHNEFHTSPPMSVKTAAGLKRYYMYSSIQMNALRRALPYQVPSNRSIKDFLSDIPIPTLETPQYGPGAVVQDPLAPVALRLSSHPPSRVYPDFPKTMPWRKAGYKPGCQNLLVKLHVDELNIGQHRAKATVMTMAIIDDPNDVDKPTLQQALALYATPRKKKREVCHRNLHPIVTRLESTARPFHLSSLPLLNTRSPHPTV
jgi:hypothetical protein